MGTSSSLLVIVNFVCIYHLLIPPGLVTFVLEGAGRLQHVGESLHGGLRVENLHILNTRVNDDATLSYFGSPDKRGRGPHLT